MSNGRSIAKFVRRLQVVCKPAMSTQTPHPKAGHEPTA